MTAVTLEVTFVYVEQIERVGACKQGRRVRQTLKAMAWLSARWRQTGRKIGRRQGSEKGGLTGDKPRQGKREKWKGQNEAEQRKGWTDSRWERKTEQQRAGRSHSWCETDTRCTGGRREKKNLKGRCWCQTETRKQAQDRQTESDLGK